MARNQKVWIAVVRITQDVEPGVIPVCKWDWTSNSRPGEKWELLGWGLQLPMPVEPSENNIASARAIDAAEYAAAKLEEKREAPPSMPVGMSEAQEVTIDDFPPKARSEAIAPYSDPADYTERTGKRFRMTKEQKERGLSREGAFSEFVAGLDA